MRDYPIFLVAGVTQQIVTQGDYFHIVEAEAEVRIGFDSEGFITRVKGMGGTAKYSNVSIFSATDQVVVISLGSGTVADSRASIDVGTITVGQTVPNSSPVNNDVSLPAGVTTRIIAPNANRKSLSIFAGEDNVANLRIGCNDSVGATQGGYIAPAGNGTIETTTGVWVYNPHTEAQSISMIELTAV